MSSVEEIRAHLEALRAVPTGSPEESVLTQFFYTPDPRLPAKLAELTDLLDNIPKEKDPKAKQALRGAAGYKMEEIAFLAMNGLTNAGRPQSWRNPGFQVDLLVSSANELFEEALRRIMASHGGPFGVLVECKATEGKVDEPTMSRFCSIMSDNLEAVVGLGVFFTLHGITGGDSPGKLSDANMRRVFHAAKHGRPIVVLERDDVYRLTTPGSLVEILRKHVEEAHTIVNSGYSKVDGYEAEPSLPDHLAALL